MRPRFAILTLTCLGLAACSRAADRDAPAAQADADRAPAVKAQVNATAATSKPPERLDDAAITGKVEAGLHEDPALSGADISVNTNSGVVTLTGLVKSREQAAEAAAHASQDGVVRVDNDLAMDLR